MKKHILILLLKSKILTILMVLIFLKGYTQTQTDSLVSKIEPVEVRGSTLIYKNYKLTKFEHIQKVLSKTNSPEIEEYLENFKRNKTTSNIFGAVGGFGIGWFIGGLIGSRANTTFKESKKGLLYVGIGFTVFGLITNGAANIALRKAGLIHNSNIRNKLSLKFNTNNRFKELTFLYKF